MAKKEEDKKEEEQPIIIKKIVKGGGHHGGAWKVAYADFVTAMMAFFLLLWLLNVVTDEQKDAITSYFDPAAPTVSETMSGAGGVLGGLSMSPQGAMATVTAPISSKTPKGAAINNKTNQKSPEGDVSDFEKSQDPSDNTQKSPLDEAKDLLREQEKIEFSEAKTAIKENPDLKTFLDSIIILETPEGLLIDITDKKNHPLFKKGKATPTKRLKKALHHVSTTLNNLINKINLSAHTSDEKFSRNNGVYTNWELSSDRANAVRRLLEINHVKDIRFFKIIGRAARDPINRINKADVRNRRISILLLKEEIYDPETFNKKAQKLAGQEGLPDDVTHDNFGESKAQGSNKGRRYIFQRDEKYRRTPGAVEFP